MFKKALFYIGLVTTAFLMLAPLASAQVVSNYWKLTAGTIQPNLSPWTFTLPYLGGGGNKNVCVDNTGLFYEKKSYNQYLILSCRTKIRIVTLSTFDGSDLHMKGQIAEALSTAALLFVDSSYLISNYFKEGVEFICFASMNDLLEKVRWYLNNDEERLNISMAGHKRWVENYSGFKSLKILFDMTTIQL